jgi:hypothetical protein
MESMHYGYVWLNANWYMELPSNIVPCQEKNNVNLISYVFLFLSI